LTPFGAGQADAAARELAARPITRVIVSPYTRALQTAQPILAIHQVPVEITHLVRERSFFICDVGSPPRVLADRFPHHSFAHLPERWWHEGIETADETIARADEFRTVMAARHDHPTTLLVSHWAFIVALTGISLANGEILEYDPASPAPPSIDWET
jgi:broad specificity phosphatase PhoE